ncbi:MAG: NUDIX hydrolase [Gemmatimonadetes bacterium]|nr:NUDIX hydrolase [Gemmatimonadota bacterium]MBT6144240.1 NUDIX hydrolase [Gemmatimonadota bacterium]MBT7859578.1 NUDIX hydrolase [Gemmatimonadota bacterium]
MSDLGVFTGASCLLFWEGRIVLEVRKTHKWEQRPDGVHVIGIGGIGGTMEEGESPLETLQREAVEEIGCPVELWSASSTIVESPAEVRVVTGLDVDGLCPAMVWEVTDPTYQVGAKVVVYLAQATRDPQPGDLPAILLADPAWITTMSSEFVSTREAVNAGVEVRSRVDMPENGLFQPVNTLRRLLAVRASHCEVFKQLMQGPPA